MDLQPCARYDARRIMSRLRFAGILLALALAACQSEGQSSPVSHITMAASVLTPPDSVGILVMPVSDAPPQAASGIAEAMATALQAADIPASTNASNRRSFRLSA